jgi:hypothetical protein
VQVGTCFNAIPANVQFLNGPLQADYEPKERVVRQRRQKHDDSESEQEEENPEDVKHMAKDPNQLSAVEQSMAVISTVLKRKSKESQKACKQYVDSLEGEEQAREKKRLKKEGPSNVDAVPFLFNPKSFTQTVENIFHFSFLVKQSNARIKVLPDSKKPVVSNISAKEKDNLPAPRQSIVAFTMEDFRKLSSAYQLKQGHLPHRKQGKKREPSASRRAAAVAAAQDSDEQEEEEEEKE